MQSKNLEVELNALISSKNQCVGKLEPNKNPTAEIIDEAERLVGVFLDLSRQYMQLKDYRKLRICYQNALELIKDLKQPPNNFFTFIDLHLRLEDMDFIPAINYFEDALRYLHTTPGIMAFFATQAKKFFDLIQASYLIVDRLIANGHTHVTGKRLYQDLFILLEQFNNEKISEETSTLIQQGYSNLLLELSLESIKKYNFDARQKDIIQLLKDVSKPAIGDELKLEKMYCDIADYFDAHQDYSIACRWHKKIIQMHDKLFCQAKDEAEKFKILLNKLNFLYKSIVNGMNIDEKFKLLTPVLDELYKMLEYPDKYAYELVQLAGMHFLFANFLHPNKNKDAERYYKRCSDILDELCKVNNLPHQLQINIVLMKMDELIRSLNPDIKKLELEEIQAALDYIDTLLLVFYPLNSKPELVKGQIELEDKCDRLITQMLKKEVKEALESPLFKELGVNTFSQLLCAVENKTTGELEALNKLKSASGIREGIFKLFTAPVKKPESSNPCSILPSFK